MARNHLNNNSGWYSRASLVPLSYKCGYCSNLISSNIGYRMGYHNDGSGDQVAGIYICSHCSAPTYVDTAGRRHPDVAFGNDVSYLPKEVGELYSEARICTSAGAYTAAVLLTRKLLMHIAVEQGANTGDSFLKYVEYLSGKGFVPPNGKHWVDHIRKKGNVANHEITIMTRDEARDLLGFTEMLLKFIFEFPMLVPKPNPDS